MKNTILKNFVAVFTAIVLVGGAYTAGLGQDADMPASADEAAWNNHGQDLVGVWITQVTRRNCATGEAIGPTFQTQNTFAKGGTMLETVQPTSFRSLGNGIWQRNRGSDRYSFVNRFMLYNPAGAFAGSGVVRVSLRLDHTGNSYTATATNDTFDANGNVVVGGGGCATSVATRLLF